MSPIVV